MPTCYVCTVHGTPSPNPGPVGCCSTCGIFTCVWDGARLHGKGAYECAICMVRVLIASADLSLRTGGSGGGGLAVAANAEQQIREFLGTEQFERDCEQLSAISKDYREGWRGLLRAQLSEVTAREFGQRLADLADQGPALAAEVEAGLAAGTVDRGLLADAAGVGEYARRLSASGPHTLASVAQAEDAARAKRELAEKIARESATPESAETVEVGQPIKEEVKEVKVMTSRNR